LLLGWAWTTVICVYLEYSEIQQIRSIGLSYFTDYVNALDQSFMIGQLALNVMFWIRNGSVTIFGTGKQSSAL
jgi:hypothetical protein